MVAAADLAEEWGLGGASVGITTVRVLLPLTSGFGVWSPLTSARQEMPAVEQILVPIIRYHPLSTEKDSRPQGTQDSVGVGRAE